MPRAATTRTAVACGAAALVVAALLARPGTAADDDAVEATRRSLGPVAPSPSAAPDPPTVVPDGSTVVRPDGVDGLRLGMATEEVVAGGFAVEPATGAGCRRVLPGLDDDGPGPGAAGWLVEDRLAAVTLDARSGEGASFLGPGIGDPLDDLPREGLLRAGTPVTVPWQRAPVVVDVAWARPAPDVRVAFADLTGDGRIDHVQLRQDGAEECAQAREAARAAEEAGLPALDLQGRGSLRIGMPVTEAADLVTLVDGDGGGDVEDGVAPAGPGGVAEARPCRLVMARDEPGLLYVVVAAADAGEPVVRGITVDAGRTDAGLAVGDPAERVAQAYPGLTTAYLEERWRQGLSADWQVDGGSLRLWPGRERVAVPAVDAVLHGPRDVVGLLQVGPGC